MQVATAKRVQLHATDPRILDTSAGSAVPSGPYGAIDGETQFGYLPSLSEVDDQAVKLNFRRHLKGQRAARIGYDCRVSVQQGLAFH